MSSLRQAERERPLGAASGLPEAVVVISGVVETGDRRGRLLGFPTANLALGSHPVSDGVWAGWLILQTGEQHLAAISVGCRPTFHGREGRRLLEAHVLDFSGDLYESVVKVGLCVRLRPQLTFASAEELVQQMRNDLLETRAWAGRR